MKDPAVARRKRLMIAMAGVIVSSLGGWGQSAGDERDLGMGTSQYAGGRVADGLCHEAAYGSSGAAVVLRRPATVVLRYPIHATEIWQAGEPA